MVSSQYFYSGFLFNIYYAARIIYPLSALRLLGIDCSQIRESPSAVGFNREGFGVTIQIKAATGFNQAAEAYERGRPDYPRQAVTFLLDTLGVSPGSTVVDLGAGSGKFTRLLATSGAHLLAVEPVEGMRVKFQQLLPGITALDGSAEHIPLPSGSVDALVAAQAFHWFDGKAALEEIHRVLKPGGMLGLIWNVRDESLPLMADLTAIMDPHEDGAPRYRNMDWKKAFERTTLFTRLQQQDFPYEQIGDTEMVVDRVGSVSFISALPVQEKERVLVQVRRAVARHQQSHSTEVIKLPYCSTIFWCARQ